MNIFLFSVSGIHGAFPHSRTGNENWICSAGQEIRSTSDPPRPQNFQRNADGMSLEINDASVEIWAWRRAIPGGSLPWRGERFRPNGVAGWDFSVVIREVPGAARSVQIRIARAPVISTRWIMCIVKFPPAGCSLAFRSDIERHVKWAVITIRPPFLHIGLENGQSSRKINVMIRCFYLSSHNFSLFFFQAFRKHAPLHALCAKRPADRNDER